MIALQEDVDFLEHFGVKGMRWGVRRDKKTGIRPIAQTLNDSKFGKLSRKNVDAHHRRKKTVKKFREEHPILTKAAMASMVGAGAVAAGALLRRHGAKQMRTVAVPDLITTARDGTKTYHYEGPMHLLKVHKKDLARVLEEIG